MRTILIIVLSVAFTISALGLPAAAIQFVSVELGTFTAAEGTACNTLTRKTKWAANDWNTRVLVTVRDATTGDSVIAEVTVPSAKVFKQTYAFSQNYPGAVCPSLFVPILGTDAEAWQGAWRASILLNGRKATEVSWEVTLARPEALAEYQAFLSRNPTSANAHYQVGAAAALAGQDALGETELKEAARLAPTNTYPPLALGRLYQRQGKKEPALEQFRLVKVLLSRGSVQQGGFTEYLQGMVDDHIKQLEP